MDRQIAKLSRRLRDEGQPPSRDLWPEIEARLENKPLAVKNTRADRWLRLGAVAAALVLLLGTGYLGGGFGEKTPTMVAGADEGLRAAAGDDLLQNLNDTISDLEAAQALDPENPKLSRMALLAHKGRADLLRAPARYL